MIMSRAKSTPASPSFFERVTDSGDSRPATWSQLSENRPMPTRRPNTGNFFTGTSQVTSAGSNVSRGRNGNNPTSKIAILPDGALTSPSLSSRILVLVLVLGFVLTFVFGFAFNAKRGAAFAAPRFVFAFAISFADFFAPAFPPTRLAYCNAPFTIT